MPRGRGQARHVLEVRALGERDDVAHHVAAARACPRSASRLIAPSSAYSPARSLPVAPREHAGRGRPRDAGPGRGRGAGGRCRATPAPGATTSVCGGSLRARAPATASRGTSAPQASAEHDEETRSSSRKAAQAPGLAPARPPCGRRGTPGGSRPPPPCPPAPCAPASDTPDSRRISCASTVVSRSSQVDDGHRHQRRCKPSTKPSTFSACGPTRAVHVAAAGPPRPRPTSCAAHQLRHRLQRPCAARPREVSRPLARVAVSSERATPMRRSPTSSPGAGTDRIERLRDRV